MTGCQQEEVIERVTEKESWRRARREQADRERKRGLGGKREEKLDDEQECQFDQNQEENKTKTQRTKKGIIRGCVSEKLGRIGFCYGLYSLIINSFCPVLLLYIIKAKILK